MIDIKFIRENADFFDEAMVRRGHEPVSAAVLKMDIQKRALQTHVQDLQAQRNEVAKQMGMAHKNGDDAQPLMEKGLLLKNELQALEEKIKNQEAELNDVLARLPNIPAEDVPVGENETHNEEVLRWGTPKEQTFPFKEHFLLGEDLGLMDFEKAADLSGARFVVLRGVLAKMERALANFMLDIHTQEFGYEECYVPLLVKSETMYGTGQLPKFEEDFFKTVDGRWLIPTAEAPLTNLVAGEILDEAVLPKRFVAYTPCFRSEAGSAGRDTRGMLRQHQFGKVELVSITHPDNSLEELDRMVLAAQTVLQRLDLPYKLMKLSTGDMGVCAAKTYDLEVWMPGQKTYREISSCSVCMEYQARRMNARFRSKNHEGKKEKPRFVHTLNGSGVAVGRALIAVIENYQQPDGSIRVPDALVPYMNGIRHISIREG